MDSELDTIALRNLRFGWWALFFFLLLGGVLEVLHGLKIGWYLDVGYRVHPKWEIDARYDWLARGTDTDADERRFKTLTLGLQYFFNKKSRLILNYEFRDAEAPKLAGTAVPNQILDDMDNRISAQVLVVF